MKHLHVIFSALILPTLLLTACGGDGGDAPPPGGGDTTPLEVSVPVPENYEWDTLAVNNTVYIDRNFTYSTVPAAYIGVQYLRTANDDKTSTGDSFLTFTINKAIDIYVGHANDDSTRPAWLTSWTSTGDALATTDRTLYLYKKTFNAGTVSISGNVSGSSMYVVLVNDENSGGANQTNVAPVISGSPSTNVTAGIAYSFTPTASDANDDALSFTMTNRPVWANLNATTGELTGTPTAGDEGIYNDITITVSDGAASDSLPAFSIEVVPVASGTALLSWTPPLTNEDGSTLEDLAGYRIYYGTTSGGSYPNVSTAPSGVSSYLVSNLAPNTYYFVITAYDYSGNESAFSNEASKLIP